MDWTGQHIDVLARLRELAALPPTNNDEAVMRESRAAEELREFEEGVLAEALFQSEQEAFAKALTIACGESPVKFQVYAIGYTRAGESEVTLEAELPARGGEAAKGRSISGAWKAAVPLFSFLVLEANNSGEEQSKHIITKSREDFEALHELLQSHVRQGGSGTAAAATPPLAAAAKALPLPKLPGRKLLNANSHTHLQKRLGRYQEYLGDLVRNPATASSSALHTFLGEASNSAPLSRRPATCTPEAQTLLQHVATPRALSSPSPIAPLPHPPSHAHQILNDIGQAILPALSPPPPPPAPNHHLSPTSASASLAQEAAASGDLREPLIGAGTHFTCFTSTKVQILTLKAQTRLAYAAAAGPPAAGACSTWGLQGLRVLQVLQGRT